MDEWAQSAGRIALEMEPDLVVGYYGSSAGWVAVQVARRCHAQSVLALRGNDVDRDLEDNDKRDTVLEALHLAHAVTTVSTEMKHKVMPLTEAPVTFIANTVDTSQFKRDEAGAQKLRSRLQLKRPVVGVFGEFKEKRGLDFLREVAPEELGYEVLLVGTVRDEVRGDVVSTWRQLPYLEGLQELCAAYSLCDVVAQPSHADGFPNVVLEAMASKVPVIARPVGGLVDAIAHGRNGWLFETPTAWRAHLADVKVDTLRQVGEHAFSMLQPMDVERAAFEEVFASVLGNGPSKRV
jgi:glycosyltransferase involved in cell wall biosynthesis